MTKPLFLLVAAAVVAAGPSASAQDETLPSPLPLDRYQGLMVASPFALATPVAAPPAPSFATEYYMTGAGRMAGKDFVTLRMREDQMNAKRISLVAGEENQGGLSLVKVEWGARPEDTKAKLRLGGEIGEVQFNQSAFERAQAAGVAPKIPTMRLPQKEPGNRGLQRNRRVMVNPMVPQALPAPGQRVPEPRRRPRIINRQP